MAAYELEKVRSRKPHLDGSNGEVVFTEPQLTEFAKLPTEEDDDRVAEDLLSEGELSDHEAGDQKSLIGCEDGGIDSDGVVREYEVALKHLGFGLFHIILLLINGVAITSDAIEVLSISFVLPVLNSPEEYGVDDTGEAWLSAIIFIGMLFGSYIWGSMADIAGRKTTLVASLTISAAFGFISAFSPWFWLFVLLRFFSGFGVGGSLPVVVPYTSEFIRNKYRGPYLGVLAMFWMIGRLLCGAFAWAIIPQGNIDIPLGNFTFHSWRLFIAVSALPSFIGAIMYLFLPESPRYLLEVGNQEKAMKGLRVVYKLNHLRSREEYPVKSVIVEGAKSGLFLRGKKDKLKLLVYRCKEVWRRTLELFQKRFKRVTPPMSVVMFCLSFGSYGVALWYPTYVGQLMSEKNMADFERHCNGSVTLAGERPGKLDTYCGCSGTIFTSFAVNDTQLLQFRVNDVTFQNVSFSNVTFDSVIFNGTEFIDCQFSNSTFKKTLFNATDFNGVKFNSVNIQYSSMCPLDQSDVEVKNFMTFYQVNVSGSMIENRTFNTSPFDATVTSEECSLEEVTEEDIECDSPSTRLYRDSFFVSASALPGNIASAIAVYLFPRNYWLAFALFSSMVSSFLLFVSSAEWFVVVVLCVFTLVSTPAWNDTSLLISELYPTHLRSTAAGIHLLVARIGAIIGTNIFGAFIRVNPSVPIFLVASLFFVGGVAALILPKTTRRTLLK